MRADASVDEAGLGKTGAINREHAVAQHVGHIERLAVGRHANVLWHAMRFQLEVVDDDHPQAALGVRERAAGLRAQLHD